MNHEEALYIVVGAARWELESLEDHAKQGCEESKQAANRLRLAIDKVLEERT